MPELSGDKIRSWHERLPSDIRSVIPEDFGTNDEACNDVGFTLESIALSVLPDFIHENSEVFAVMGRARRIRVLAWMANRAGANGSLLLNEIINEEGDGSGDFGTGKVAPLFREDLRALAEALGPRMARLQVSGGTLTAVLQAGYVAEAEAQMPSRKG
jgi:hypothetical protein